MARKRSPKRTRKAAGRRKTTARRKATSHRETTRAVRRKAAAPRRKAKKPAPGQRPTEEQLQGPPPREATLMRSDRERAAEARLAERTATSPRLTGGDVDADWERAGSTGEEAVGGSVATPDKSVVDDPERDARRHRRED